MVARPNRTKYGPRTSAAVIADVLPRFVGSRGLQDSGNLHTIFEQGWTRMWQRMAALGASYDTVVKQREDHWKKIVDSLYACESPIERVLLTALLVADYPGTHIIPAMIHYPKNETTFPESECVIVPQFAFAKYRMDFGVIVRHNGRQLIVDVECDGADYHGDKVRDMHRDNYFRSWGIPVLRFKGSEIQEYPFACADKVVSCIIEWRGS